MPRTRPPRQEGIQLPLVPGGSLLIHVEALLDPTEHTVVFVVEAIDVPASNLVALWSSSPLGWDEMTSGLDQAVEEFKRLIWHNTGPF